MAPTQKPVSRLAGIPGQYRTGEDLFADEEPVFLPDEEYAHALRTFVFTCVDLLIINSATGKLLLGKRQQEPQPDWWVIGGRMYAGDALEMTAERNARRELGGVVPTAFEHITTTFLIWDSSAQGGPCHSTSVLLACKVTPEEAEAIKLNDEYSAWKWVDPTDIIDTPLGEYHPALVQMVQAYVKSEYSSHL